LCLYFCFSTLVIYAPLRGVLSTSHFRHSSFLTQKNDGFLKKDKEKVNS
jgi:hypothetical protein